jgi:hypothetical protein
LGASWGWRRQTWRSSAYGALLDDVGCGAVLAPFFAGQELLARLDES